MQVQVADHPAVQRMVRKNPNLRPAVPVMMTKNQHPLHAVQATKEANQSQVPVVLPAEVTANKIEDSPWNISPFNGI